MLKIKNINIWIKKEGVNWTISQFIHVFYSSNLNKKCEMIKEEPEVDFINRDICLIVCIVHKIANDCNIKVPKWVFDKKYMSEEPYFQFDTKNKEYRDFLIQNAPEEFKTKNMYFTANVVDVV